MNDHPTVSVLTTCYNREEYIAETIESVLNSSFHNFEYIIVDDCSSDDSAGIAQRYAKLDSRVKVYVNERNLGDYANRNRAAALASGTYIKYIDSDDIFYSHGLQVMADCMQRFPEAALGICRPPDNTRPMPFCLEPAEAYRYHFFSVGLFGNGPTSAIIHRERFVSLGGFPEFRYIGDMALWFALARSGPVVLMPRGLTWWRVHPGQEIAQETRTMDAVLPRYSMTKAALDHSDCPLQSSEVFRAHRIVREELVKTVFRIARNSTSKAAGITIAARLGISDFGRVVASKLLRGV